MAEHQTSMYIVMDLKLRLAGLWQVSNLDHQHMIGQGRIG